MQSDMVRCSN